jgi:quercetin dioxygenase-like cupin family protein
MKPRDNSLMAVEDVSELVAYQTGSVVSRVILKTPGGTVTAFAFDAGEGLSEHSTPHDALVQVTEGEALITIGGERHIVRAGQMLKLPGSVPHAVTATQRFTMLLTMLKSQAA